MSSHLYLPIDISRFFFFTDKKQSEISAIKENIWIRRDELLGEKDRSNKTTFFRKIDSELLKYINSEFYEDMQSVNNVFEEIGSHFRLFDNRDEDELLKSYFKVIRLRLEYPKDQAYVRIKLRTLIGIFNYKRRSLQLIEKIQKEMKILKIVSYTKGYVECNIAEIKLDEMFIFRLKE